MRPRISEEYSQRQVVSFNDIIFDHVLLTTCYDIQSDRYVCSNASYVVRTAWAGFNDPMGHKIIAGTDEMSRFN